MWSIGTSGTLTQTDVHVSAGASDTEGLNRIAGAAVTPDGRLLFAGSGHDSDSLDSSTLGIWRVNAEASTVSFVRALSDRRMPRRPGVVTLGPAGRFLFVLNDIRADAETGLLSVYEVNAAEENLASVASYGEDIPEGTIGLAATREVLTVATPNQGSVALWQRNDNGTLRFASRHDSFIPIDLAASPAGGLVFSRAFSLSSFVPFITVWQVQGIPRVPAGQEVRVMVNAEQAPVSALTVIVEARQGSRVRTAAATLMPSDTQAEAVFSGSDLGRGEWIFSASVPADMENIADASAARATLRISRPLIRLSNLSGVIPEGADLNIRVSTEGMVPVAEDAEVTLRATLQESAQQRTVTGRLLEGQTSVTVTFAGETALTEGEWTVSAETTSTLLQTDANLSFLTVIVGLQPRLLLELTGGSALVASDGMITLILRLMPALPAAVTVTMTVTDEDSGNMILPQQQVALSSSWPLTFPASNLGTGRRLFTARGPAGVLEDSGADVTVLVDTAVRVVLSANPERDVFPGDEVRLSAEVQIESSGSEAGISIMLGVAVTVLDGSTRSNVLIPVSAETSTGGLTFIPDAVPGAWTFTVIKSDGISASTTPTVMVEAVEPLDFNDPPGEVSADDLVLLLRYERLCAAGDSRPPPANCTALSSDAALAAGLAFDRSPYRLADLQNARLPDVTGTGISSVQTLTILLQALANVQDELLLPAAASSLLETTIAEAEQARNARLRIIRQILGRK